MYQSGATNNMHEVDLVVIAKNCCGLIGGGVLRPIFASLAAGHYLSAALVNLTVDALGRLPFLLLDYAFALILLDMRVYQCYVSLLQRKPINRSCYKV